MYACIFVRAENERKPLIVRPTITSSRPFKLRDLDDLHSWPISPSQQNRVALKSVPRISMRIGRVK